MTPNNQQKNRSHNRSHTKRSQGNSKNREDSRRNSHSRKEERTKFYKTLNMFSIFHQEYFENGSNFPESNLYDLIRKSLNKDKRVDSDFEKIFKSRNQQLSEFEFNLDDMPLQQVKDVAGYQGIQLKTTYPGLLIGTGYPHGFSAKGSLKASLQFDYVTGLPTVPGSSLKGTLRSGFPLSAEELASNKDLSKEEQIALKEANQMKFQYIQGIIGSLNEEEILELRDLVFGEFDWADKEAEAMTYQPSDVFLGGFPSIQNKESKLLELEYITPHDESGFKNPIPIPLLKVKPGISFEFGFILRDTVLKNGKTISVAEKSKLFTQILEDFGVGAKTNVGFGQLVRA